MLTAADLRAIGRGLSETITQDQNNRLEALALDKIQRSAVHRSMALTELAELRSIAGELQLDPVRRAADALWEQTMNAAGKGEVVLAPFELYELMKQYKTQDDQIGQRTLASFLVNDYLVVDGPGWALGDHDWYGLARLVEQHGDEILKRELFNVIADRLMLDRGFGRLGRPYELASWLDLIRASTARPIPSPAA